MSVVIGLFFLIMHQEAVVFPFVLYGELDGIVLLVNMLEELILILFSDEHPGVTYVPPQNLGGCRTSTMASSSDFSMKRFVRTSERGDPMAMP